MPGFNNWPLVSGVYKLTDLPSYWSLLPEAAMKEFLSQVRALGWRKAILESKEPKVRGLYLFTDCPSRSDGTFYLNLNRESSVLDLGSGWGSFTFGLSPRVKGVVAADTNFESLEFIALRAKEEGRDNISAVNIPPLDLGPIPFPDKQFEAVIMNGVLEWVGSYSQTGDPLQIQGNCLKEVNRILKPGGELFIGIENRFGLKYFHGAPDDHLTYYSKSPPLYTTILPRFLANFLARKKLGIPYRTYTHSLWGYQRLLKKAGFQQIEAYYPVSDYRAASTRIIPIKSREVPGLAKLLCDSYYIIGRKNK